MTFPGLLIFWPPKIPTSTPPLGWGGQFFLGRNHPQICRDLCILNPFSDLFFAFKVTISRHFAGYASVALETIWLHEPRDLIFLGPPMTLLCLSRYSSSYFSPEEMMMMRLNMMDMTPRKCHLPDVQLKYAHQHYCDKTNVDYRRSPPFLSSETLTCVSHSYC